MKRYIIGIGEALWDMLPSGKQMGGAPANFVYFANHFGHDAIAVSALGDDALGRELALGLDASCVEHNFAIVPQETGTVAVTLSSDGVPQYEIVEGVAWDNIPWSASLQEVAQNAKCVCFGSLAQRGEVSRATIRRVLETAPKDALIVFDINLRQHFYSREVIEYSCSKANILKINDEELVVVATMLGLGKVLAAGDGVPSEQDSRALQKAQCLELLERFGLEAVVLTCGAKGSMIVTAKESSWLDTPKVDVVDTVGAGDSFTAAFVCGLLDGLSIPQAHSRAVKVSAYVCTQPGAMPPISSNLF